MTLRIETFALGPWQTNCYLLHTGGGTEAAPADCWIVDAGFEPEPMIRYILAYHLQPRQILLTHAHLDHIAGLHAMRAKWPELPILIHPSEKSFLTDPSLNLSMFLDEPIEAPPATGALNHGEKLTLGGETFEVRHTPGHSPGGITLYCAALHTAIVGDTLFRRSVGRHDFPTSDVRALIDSIHQQLFTLPDNTRILPGHGDPTTIGEERRENPYVGGGQ